MTGVLLCFCEYGICQIYDFSDGRIPDNWYGQKDYFEINQAHQLHLLAPAGSSNAFVSWDVPSITAYVWEFYVQYDFAASTTNYASFYVLSQQQDPAAPDNKAYFLKIGGITGNTDKVELYYQDGTSKTKILESSSGLAGASKVTLRIRLSRSETGNWVLYADATGKTEFVREASGLHQNSEHFLYSALQCIYSSTRRDKIYFDDIKTYEPFMFGSYTFDDEQSIRLSFNRNITDTHPVINILSENMSLISEVRVSLNELYIRLAEPLTPGTYSISFPDLSSTDHERLLDTLLQFEKKPFYYTGQLRISELMPDPTPSYGLPESEFIEIVNTGKSVLDLQGFTIHNATKACVFPSRMLAPDSCVILVPLHACPAFRISNCMELNCFPTLHNDKDSISLFSKDMTLLDAFYYSIDNLANDYKRQGGYSIVKILSPADCIINQEQKYSNCSIGGTPGFAEKMPITDKIEFHSSSISEKRFLLNSTIFGFIKPDDIHLPIAISSVGSIGILPQNQWTVNLSAPLEAGTMMRGFIQSMKNCLYRNTNIEFTFDLVYPKVPEKGEVFLNELLYNPLPGGVDFIELINVAGKYIQLKNVHLFHTDQKNKTQHLVIDEEYILPPEGFRVFTSDPEVLFSQHPNTEQSNCFRLKPFISLPDEGGRLSMIYGADTLDQVRYGDFLQNPLNRENEGISLEKINPFTMDFIPSNWTSSASKATAGFTNSQFNLPDDQSSEKFYCKPCHVTTQYHGQSNPSLLYLSTDSGNSRGSISIYSLAGEKVMDLFINQILAAKNVFQWNGQGYGNVPLPSGIYIAVAEWWLPDGKKRIMKIPLSTSAY